MRKPKITMARLKALDHHIRAGKRLPPGLQKFAAQHVRNWPKNPNRYFGLSSHGEQ